MIRPLRRAHHVSAYALGILLPIFVLLALLMRPGPAIQIEWPSALRADRPAAAR